MARSSNGATIELSEDFQSVAVNPMKFTVHHIERWPELSNTNFADTDNCTCPQTDAEGSSIIVAPPPTGVVDVVVVVAGPCGGVCLPPSPPLYEDF